MRHQLLDGERPIRTARQHWSIFIPSGLACLVALVAGGLALWKTPHKAGSVNLHTVKLALAVALVVVVVGVMGLRWLRWHFEAYTLTDHRIVHTRGVISRVTESIALDRVQDTSVSQGMLGRMLGFGEVEIESASEDGREVLHRLADPQGFSHDMLSAIEARRTGRPYPGGETAGPAAGGYTPPGGYGPPPGYGYGPPAGHDGL